MRIDKSWKVHGVNGTVTFREIPPGAVSKFAGVSLYKCYKLLGKYKAVMHGAKSTIGPIRSSYFYSQSVWKKTGGVEKLSMT